MDEAGFENRFLGRNLAGLEYLAPPIAEPTIADDETFARRRELPRHRFHRISSAAGNDDRSIGVIDVLQCGGNIAHHLLEGLRHVIERAVCENHRIFKKPIRINA